LRRVSSKAQPDFEVRILLKVQPSLSRTSSTRTHPADLPNLDLMRSFAVLAVVIDHTCQALGIWEDGRWSVVPLGIFAVYLFFVHTTLVLMWSLERQPNTLNFYIRRAFRIYPLAMVVVAVVVLLNLPVCGGPHTTFLRPWRDWHVVLSNLFLVQNLFRHPPVESVLWSLPLEVQMYIGLPVLFAFAQKERKLWPIVTIWAAMVVCVFCLLPRVADAFNVFAYVPNFIPGVIAYVGFMHSRPRWPAWSFALLVGVLAFAYMGSPNRPAGWFCCLLLGLLLPNFRQATSRVLRKAGHKIAQYSYGIYLLHMWAIAVAFHYLHLHNVMGKLIVEVLVIVLLAPAAYHCIEKPLIEYGGRLANRVAPVRRAGIPADENPAP
jgi:peptidoglycan/LPS O-acetylase OafA/YrhL